MLVSELMLASIDSFTGLAVSEFDVIAKDIESKMMNTKESDFLEGREKGK